MPIGHSSAPTVTGIGSSPGRGCLHRPAVSNYVYSSIFGLFSPAVGLHRTASAFPAPQTSRPLSKAGRTARGARTSARSQINPRG